MPRRLRKLTPTQTRILDDLRRGGEIRDFHFWGHDYLEVYPADCETPVYGVRRQTLARIIGYLDETEQRTGRVYTLRKGARW
jgi:hypothetical protein